MMKESDLPVNPSSSSLLLPPQWPWYRRMYESGLDACERQGFRLRTNFATSATLTHSDRRSTTVDDKRAPLNENEVQSRRRTLVHMLAASNHRGKRRAHVWMTSANALLVQDELFASIMNGSALVLLQPAAKASRKIVDVVGKGSNDEKIFRTQLQRILFDPWKDGASCSLQRVDVIFPQSRSFWNKILLGLISRSFGGPDFTNDQVDVITLPHRSECADVVRKDVFARCERKKMTYVLTIQNDDDTKDRETYMDVHDLYTVHEGCPCLSMKREKDNIVTSTDTKVQSQIRLLIDSMRQAAKDRKWGSKMHIKPKEVLLVQRHMDETILDRGAVIVLQRSKSAAEMIPPPTCARTKEEHAAHLEYIVYRACRQIPFEWKRIDIIFAKNNSIDQAGKCYQIVRDAPLWYSDRVTKVVILQGEEEHVEEERNQMFERARAHGFVFRILVSE